MEPDLDALLRSETEAAEELNQAYIRYTMARNRSINALRELREGHPTLFTERPPS